MEGLARFLRDTANDCPSAAGLVPEQLGSVRQTNNARINHRQARCSCVHLLLNPRVMHTNSAAPFTHGFTSKTRSSVLVLVMAALRSGCGHYIFVLWFLSSFFFFFIPRLISAVADWMSTILPHMV